MQPLEFNDITTRLRRNLMGAAFLIIAIAGFDIKVGKASASGMELDNLTTDVVLTVLLAFLVYHAFAFCIRAFEEYRCWELRLSQKDKAVFGRGGTGLIELAEQMRQAGDICQRIIANGDTIREDNQDVLTRAQVRYLMQAADSAMTYARRFRNFPKISRLRFWFWDIGIPSGVSVIAVLFAVSVIPAGLVSRWLP